MKTQKTSTELLERALAHQRAGRIGEAESFYRKAIFRRPDHEEALFAFSVLLFQTGRFEETARYLERLAAIRPDEPVYLTNLGEAYRRSGDLERAASTLERVLASHPDLPEAHHDLGLTLLGAGAASEALSHLERAAALRPNDAQVQANLAWVLVGLHRIEEAIAHARRAVELAPHLACAHHQLANALNERGDKAGAVASYRRAVELDPSDPAAHSNLILAALADPRYDAGMLLAEARAWAALHAEPLRPHRRPHTNDRDPERRLRIGYVSPDFRAHPVQQFLMPLLEHHDRSAFEIYLYSSVERPDLATQWYRELTGDRFRDIRRTDDVRAAELVRRDRIDVLVDLALHSAGGRLRIFACKPAPVQVTWLGYAGTTGLDTIDYRITDPYLDPPSAARDVYSEACLHLPETAWCYAPLERDLPVGPLPALGNGFITFGCQSSYRKVHTGVLSLWARVLSQVTGSRLMLYAEEHARGALRELLASAGVQAERIEFVARAPRRAYLERYRRVDIALDTFPFAGATTSLDSLWMGVPVVTLSGGTSLHRAGASIAANVGLPELVATTEEAFVATAVALAGDIDRLGRLRAELRSRLEASPLGDVPRFARHLEAAYRTAWRRYCAGR